MRLAAVVWTYWMSLWLLAIGTVLVLTIAIGYLVLIVRPYLMWKQWKADQDAQMERLWAVHRAQSDELAALRSAQPEKDVA